MDFKTLISTFGLIFLAELGDKTQLASMNMAASSKKPLEVYCGALAGFAAVTAVGVLFGGALTRIIPLNVIHAGSGILFIIIGALMLAGKF